MAGQSARAAYRTRQVYHALRPQVQEQELARIRDLLNPDEALLFFAMEKRDQRHALEVKSRLEAQGVTDSDLLTAALLHDCGKGEVPVLLRIAKVASPAFVKRAADERKQGWRSAAYRLAHHPELGARLAEAAGSSSTAVALIRGHVQPGDEAKLAMLLAADDAS